MTYYSVPYSLSIGFRHNKKGLHGYGKKIDYKLGKVKEGLWNNDSLADAKDYKNKDELPYDVESYRAKKIDFD